jgi:hypothetical protein
MVSRPDGHQHGLASRRFRFDDLTSTKIRASASVPSGDSSGHSGRRFVIVAGAIILSLWGCSYLVFREWRSRYRARAEFGATQVAPVIDALAETAPPGVNGQTWRDAVRETHNMLVLVTGANLLDIRQMQSLRDELEQVVARARAHPETARDELAGVWNAMSDRAEFLLQEGSSGRRKTQLRPAILPPRPAKRQGANPLMPMPKSGSFGAVRGKPSDALDQEVKVASLRSLLRHRARSYGPIAS